MALVPDGRGRAPGERPPVPRLLDVAAAWTWRCLVVAAGVVAAVLLLARLKVVVLPLFAASLVAVALSRPTRFLQRRRVPRSLAALISYVGFFAVVAGIGALVATPIADQVGELRPVVAEGVDDVTRWLAEGPAGIDERELGELRQRASEQLRSSGGGFVKPVVVVGEVLAGIVLAIIAGFFLLKDGPELRKAVVRRFPEDTRPRIDRALGASTRALGGYLRGAAALGAVEGVIIAIAITVAGGELALPVALLTFVAAFVPVVGAIAAGVVAVLVALVTAGTEGAIIVGIVALVVQQLDNDLLAPVVYGKAVSLHPLAILVAVTSGAALAGVAGTFLAVPVLAVVVAVAGALRSEEDDPTQDGPVDDADRAAGTA